MNNQNDSGTENPQGNKQLPLITENLTYKEVEQKVLEFLPGYQTGLKLILAVAVSSQFENPHMLWLLLVGAPSSGKTDLVRLIKDSDIAFYLDNLTQNAFISGERSTEGHKVYDLLPLINEKCLIIKDWTAIFSLDEKMTRKILGDLVGIYDKEFAKFSSRRGNISYTSSFSQLGAITPSTLNKHSSYMNMVGPRFLCYIMPEATQKDKDESYEIIFSHGDRTALEQEARKYTSSYLKQLSEEKIEIKDFDSSAQIYFKIASELVAQCRGIVSLQAASFRDEDGTEVKYYDVSDIQVESPWRAVQQLIMLSHYLAFVTNKQSVESEELQIIKDVVLSSMPADRAQALRFIKLHNGKITAKELSQLSERSSKTSRRLLDELCALKVLDKFSGLGRTATDYKLNDKYNDFILLSPSEFLEKISGTENPQSINDLTEEEIKDIFSQNI
jgi:hypothetical protein